MEKITKEKVDTFVESLIEQGHSVKELKESLMKYSELTEDEISLKLKELNHKFVPVYSQRMKKLFITFLILGGITLILIVLYQYFEHKQNQLISDSIQQGKSTYIGNGKYLTSGNFNEHRILGSIAGWTGLVAIISLISTLFFWVKKTLILRQKE